jgi:hypothetical protein
MLFYAFLIIFAIGFAGATLTAPAKIDNTTQTLLALSNAASINDTNVVAAKFQTQDFSASASGLTSLETKILGMLKCTDVKSTTFVLNSELHLVGESANLTSLQADTLNVGAQIVATPGSIVYTQALNSTIISPDALQVSNSTNAARVTSGNIDITNRFLESLVYLGTDMTASTYFNYQSSVFSSLLLPGSTGIQYGSFNFALGDLIDGFTLRLTGSGFYTCNGDDENSFAFCIGNTTSLNDLGTLPLEIILGGDALDRLTIQGQQIEMAFIFECTLSVNKITSTTFANIQAFGNFFVANDGFGILGQEHVYQKTSTIDVDDGLQLSVWGIIGSSGTGHFLPFPRLVLEQFRVERLK